MFYCVIIFLDFVTFFDAEIHKNMEIVYLKNP